MPDKQDEQQRKGEQSGQTLAPPASSTKPSREVVVTHLDSPPSGKRSIHPRRPMPIVPTRDQRTGEQSGDDTDGKESSDE